MRHDASQFLNFAMAGVVGACALFGAKEARATPKLWGSLTNIVKNASVSYGYPSTDYSGNSICFSNDQTGPLIVNNPKFTLIYFANFGVNGYRPVGGLDGIGTTASGFINANKTTAPYIRGLNIGQTANQTEGNVDDGYWQMFVDVNGDGDYGTYDSAFGLFDFDEGEMINDVRVAHFQGFQIDAGTLSAGDISGWYILPAWLVPSMRLGAAVCLVGPSNLFTFGVSATNTTTFRIEYRDSLTNATWSNLGQYNVTGAVTVVTDTNAVSQRFYHAVSP